MLCQLAHHFPPFVEVFLERGNKLRRRFREESVTDLLMNGLLALGAGRVVVEYPNEPVTGADMEWNFVNPDDDTFFRILLQAKQAYGRGKNWTRHSYRELLHTSGTGTTLQSVQLCNTARATRATYPLYIFYHSRLTCSLARADGISGVTGAALADGYEIERLVVASATRKLRTQNKSVGKIEPLLFALSDLFCPPTILPIGPMAFVPPAFSFPVYIGQSDGRLVMGRPIPPTPQTVRDRLNAALRREPESIAPDVSGVPEVANEIPDEIRRVIALRDRDMPIVAGLNRWRITFVSESPQDLEAELKRMRHG